MFKKAICILLGQTKADHYDNYTLSTMRLANDLGYTTITYSMPRISRPKNELESQIYNLIDYKKFAGVIINSKSFYEKKNLVALLEKRVRESGVPYIVLGNSVYKDTWDAFKNTEKYETTTDHLIEVHNCKRILCLGGVMGEPNQRINGFINSMKRHGLPCGNNNLLYGGYWTDCAEKFVKDLVFGNIEMPDAVVCIHDRIAVALVTELYRNGIRVPEDMLVAGIDGESVNFKNVFSITTTPLSANSHGERAMAELHRLISGEELNIPFEEHELVTGDSCGCGTKKDSFQEIRRSMEKYDQENQYAIYYRNSEIQERLFRLNSYADLPFILDNHTYLVPDMKTFSLSLVTGENEAECLFHSYWNYGSGTIKFDYRDVLPPESETDNMVVNLHVLPVAFSDNFFGYITAGYYQPIMYNRFLQNINRDISIALDILTRGKYINSYDGALGIEPLGKHARVNPDVGEDVQETDIEENVQSDVIYAKKDGVMTKVNIDNVLFFEAMDKRVYVALKSGNYEVKSTLSELEFQLSAHNYMRVSKSVLLNLDRVAGVRIDDDRSLVAVLQTKQEVRISRKYSDQFKLRMGLK